MPCVFSWLKAQRCGATLDQYRDTAICFWRVLDLQFVPYNNALHFRHGSQESVLIALESVGFWLRLWTGWFFSLCPDAMCEEKLTLQGRRSCEFPSNWGLIGEFC